MISDDKPWFAPKRYGIGAGFPIAREGWLLLGAYALAIAGCVTLFADEDDPVLALAVIVPLTLIVMVVSWRKTRGGWRWRWGEDA